MSASFGRRNILFAGCILLGGSLAAAIGYSTNTADLGLNDATLGSLPQVPGLLDRESKEPGFSRAFLRVLKETGASVDRVAALISEESGYEPYIANPIGAVGLMQWLPAYTHIFGTTPEKLKAMTATEQLTVVKATLLKWPAAARQDPALGGWGNSAGAPDSQVIASLNPPHPPLNNSPVYYTANKGYDKEGKGYITAGDVRRAVYGRLKKAKTLPRIGPNGKPIQ